MNNFFLETLKKLTIRARVALLLSMAESVLPELESNKEHFSLSREGLDLAWEWHDTSKILGDTLTDYISNPDPDNEKGDLALYQLEYEDGSVKQATVIVVCYAVSFAAKSACEMEKNSLPDFLGVLELDNVKQEIFNFPEKTNIFDKNKFIKAANFLIKKYSTSNLDELGEPVNKESLIEIFK